MASDDFSPLEQWFNSMLARLEPAQRKRVATKLGQIIRRNNTARQGANEEPDGSSMAPRKKREHRNGRIKNRAGKMFRRIRLARQYKIDADPDGFELSFRNAGVAKVAAEHHFGLEGRVGRLRNGRTIRTKYVARELLGFGRNDREAAFDIAAEMIQP